MGVHCSLKRGYQRGFLFVAVCNLHQDVKYPASCGHLPERACKLQGRAIGHWDALLLVEAQEWEVVDAGQRQIRGGCEKRNRLIDQCNDS
jgi:hypothetical protein